MLACYTNRVSAHPGERFALHASATRGPCSVSLFRVGATRALVFRADDIAVGEHTVPDHADRNGCGWPPVLEIETGEDWLSGYYDIVLEDAAGERTHHFIVVKPPKGGRKASAALVLATSTYNAYNYWGGANAYCDVAALLSGKAKLPEAMQGAIGVLSTQRPFPQMLLAPPEGAPRLVNLTVRGFREPPFAGDPAWREGKVVSPYDGSAGFLQKWEHAFAAWAEGENLPLDYLTDYDLETPGVLDGYAAAVLVGHSEYWSAGERDEVERYVDAGGKLAIFSGNTAFRKVRYEDDGKTYVCHKWKGFEADPIAKVDAALGTHLWSHRAFGRPEAAITGLSFLFGGYHRLGLCVARGSAGYTVYDEHHWALEDADLFYGDVIGSDLPFIGYENDGCRFQFADDGRLKPVAMIGVPENLEIIAIAPCAFGEESGRGYRPLIPPENLGVIAREVFEDPTPKGEARILRGHAVVASFRRGAGEVFNGGTTEWAHGLAAQDPYVTRITRNVLRRFGAFG